MITPVWLLLKREMRQSVRRWSDLISPLVFFVLVSSLFPLAISPAADVLRQVGPGVLWVAALLSMLLSMNRLFRDDFEDGSLEQLVLAPQPLVLLVLGKVLAHWLQMVLPLLLLTPAVAIAYDLPGEATRVLLLSLLLGTPALSLLGGITAALTVGLRQGAGVLAILLLPLSIPVLIFGSRATDLALEGMDTTGPLMLLGAISLLSASLAPFGIAAALRVSLD
ncbi:MAG: heme exporter protein CcmB [Gammaproteobacteria bacterium]|nr:heme exporter protein CcmB [Gammaproteobacteria bacterium]